MPLPASTTTLSRRPVTGASVSRWAAYASSTSCSSIEPWRLPAEAAPAATASRISARPLSRPIGVAPARHILMPLYCAGLWLAVNITPGCPRCPEAK